MARRFLVYSLCFLIGFQPLILQAAELTVARDISTTDAIFNQGGGLFSNSDIIIDASRLASEEETTLSAKTGKISLLTNKDTEFERKEKRKKSTFWQQQSDKGEFSETIKHVIIEAGGGFKIDAGNGIIVEYEKTGNLDDSIDQLAEAPGLEWVGQLRNDPRVDWVEVQAKFEEWDHESQGLTEAGAVLVSIVVGAVSGGALSSLSASLTANGVTQAALQAGLSTLTQQASIAFINNGGDIGEVFETLGSSASLRSLATAMVAAGLTTHALNDAGVSADLPNTDPLTNRVIQDINRGIVRASLNASISTVIQGGDLDDNLRAALKQEASSVIGKHVAQKIGSAAHDGDINTATQLIAHAALGCATGKLASDDCGSGAAGAVIGEVTGKIQAKRIEDRLRRELLDGTITDEEALILVEDLRADGVNMARFAAGLSAAIAGGDAAVAAEAGGNAAENNAFFLIVPAVILLIEVVDKALLVKDAINITVALNDCNQGSQASCDKAGQLMKQAAVDVGMEFTIGSIVPGSKVAADLLRWAKKNTGKAPKTSKSTNPPDAGNPRPETTEIQPNAPKQLTAHQEQLIQKLPKGTKINPDDVVDVRRLKDGRTVWLERNPEKGGLKHIKEHESQFADKGISKDEIASVVMNALEEGNVVGTNGKGKVYQITHKGVEKHIIIGVSDNGFVVRANPTSTWKSLP